MLLGAALPCLMVIKKVWRVNNKIAHAQSLHGIVLFQFFMGHCEGAHKAQEMSSTDQAEQMFANVRR